MIKVRFIGGWLDGQVLPLQSAIPEVRVPVPSDKYKMMTPVDPNEPIPSTLTRTETYELRFRDGEPFYVLRGPSRSDFVRQDVVRFIKDRCPHQALVSPRTSLADLERDAAAAGLASHRVSDRETVIGGCVVEVEGTATTAALFRQIAERLYRHQVKLG